MLILIDSFPFIFHPAARGGVIYQNILEEKTK